MFQSRELKLTQASKSKTTRKAPKFDSLEQEVFLNLWRTFECLKSHETELFEQFGLTSQQYNLLRLLRAVRPNMLQTLSLAERLVSRAPDITRMLDKLEDRGLIVRDRPLENRRVVQVGITDSGSILLDQIAQPLHDCHVRQLGHLSAAKLKQLIQLLRAVRQPHEDQSSSWR
ncbi:MAG: MarR family transcriptional regulator [Pirellulaceae bacterium]|nr:MarR family transcriptional regulator [Pirellulaceae bacterium]